MSDIVGRTAGYAKGDAGSAHPACPGGAARTRTFAAEIERSKIGNLLYQRISVGYRCQRNGKDNFGGGSALRSYVLHRGYGRVGCWNTTSARQRDAERWRA